MSYPGVDSETYTRLEKLAVAVAKHGDAFEAKVAEKQIGNADFAFLTAKQGYSYLYYRDALRRVTEEGWTLEKLAQERSSTTETARKASASSAPQEQQVTAPPRPPPQGVRPAVANTSTLGDASAFSSNARLTSSQFGLRPFEAQWEEWSEKQAQAAAARSPAALISVQTVQAAVRSAIATTGLSALPQPALICENNGTLSCVNGRAGTSSSSSSSNNNHGGGDGDAFARMVHPPWELSRAADEAVTAYQAWCTGSLHECPVNLEHALSRSRTYANPAAFDRLCAHYMLEPFASARCNVSEEASWANEFRVLHAHDNLSGANNGCRTGSVSSRSASRGAKSRSSQTLVDLRLPSSLARVNELVHQTVTGLEAEVASLPLESPERVRVASVARDLRVALNAVVGPASTTAATADSSAAPHHHHPPRVSPEPWFYDTLREEQNKRWADGRVARGAEHAKEQRMSDAMRCYEQALVQCPRHVNALVARGALLANNGHLERALSDFQRAIHLDPRAPNAAAYLATVNKKLADTKSRSSSSSSDSSSSSCGINRISSSNGSRSSSSYRPVNVDSRPQDSSRPRYACPAESTSSSSSSSTAPPLPRATAKLEHAPPPASAADSLTADDLRELLQQGQQVKSGEDGFKKRKHEKHDRSHKRAKKEKKHKHEKKERKKKKAKRESSSSSSECEDTREEPPSEHPILSRTKHKFWG